MLGTRGERAAARFLKRKRLRVLVRNYSCPRGELDLVCSDGTSIVFVEVKTRTSDAAQYVTDALSEVQTRRIQRAAQHFLAKHRAGDRRFRFDLVTVVWPEHGKATIEHHPDAFGPGQM